jgi:hypothetical protein
MKKISVLLMAAMLLCSNFVTSAQEEETSGRQFYVELGGAGVLFSANYQSRLKPAERLGWGYRVGIGYAPLDVQSRRYYEGDEYHEAGYYDDYLSQTIYTIPLGVNYIFGKANSPHTFEAGAGFTIMSKKTTYSNYLFGSFPFMYRRIPTDGGFTWGIGLIPIIKSGGEINLTGAFNIGYSF